MAAQEQTKETTKVTTKVTTKERIPKGVLTIAIAATVLCLALLFGSYRLYNKIEGYNIAAQSVQEQIDAAYEESSDLARESEYVKTEEYMEQVARDRLGLVKQDEIIFQKDNQ